MPWEGFASLFWLHIYVFSTFVSVDCSKAVPLLQFFFVRASVVSYVVFVLSSCSFFVPCDGCAS